MSFLSNLVNRFITTAAQSFDKSNQVITDYNQPTPDRYYTPPHQHRAPTDSDAELARKGLYRYRIDGKVIIAHNEREARKRAADRKN